MSEGIYFLDDYLFVETSLDACSQALTIALETCRLLGVPIAIEKIKGPSPSIAYLGLLIDTQKGEI